MAKKIFVGVAWPYANGPLHAGHLAGVYLPADIFCRYHRIQGNPILMVSGSDAHGTPITVRAEKEGVSPADIAERFHREFQGYWASLGISFDHYTTTRSLTHQKTVGEIFSTLLDKGYLFQKEVEAYYDPIKKRFLPDRYIEGTCPRCGYERARGDQCEGCGTLLEPSQLLFPRSLLSGEPPVLRTTIHFFFDLPAFQDRLVAWVKENHHWRSNVYRFTLSFLAQGLQPRAITRDLEWGIPVPYPGYEQKRIYVWFEAVIGYLSATIEYAQKQGNPDGWKEWWQDPEVRSYYFIGKDNIPFHTIIWPAILLGVGALNLPYDVPASEYLVFGGAKASKSQGIGVTLPDLLRHFTPDEIRYGLAAVLPESSDTNFELDEFLRRHNEELVGIYGNLIHRTITFAHNYLGGQVPSFPGLDAGISEAIEKAFQEESCCLEAVRLRDGLRVALGLARLGNRYFEEKAPWKSARENPPAMKAALGNLLNLLQALKILWYPFLPHASQRLHELLGASGKVEETGWAFRPLEPHTPLGKPLLPFRKLEATQLG
ncbi:methionine--tRNA ligase [Candidatus Methylacidithermus pantelleriae]|uniref:Methionine--tRNA ligase n=1 Tax=Candidatus Methylacidithermus pantelleriae TaxID=2744239 RepID=A0A8J2FRY1_9BACT|nr:methionine--tRNA ligase [Candidatus Methylacidithermus pantelleriae]CAF0694940.1 Methionine--tRNA ligase [Candidatus Methylacidithermus pantelleriae]